MLGCLELLLVPAPLTDCCVHRCSDGHRAGAPWPHTTGPTPATVLVTMGTGRNGEHLGMGGDGEK